MILDIIYLCAVISSRLPALDGWCGRVKPHRETPLPTPAGGGECCGKTGEPGNTTTGGKCGKTGKHYYK